MHWFLFFFFLTYAFLHLYVYLRIVKPFLRDRRLTKCFVIVLFLTGYFSPLFFRYADLQGNAFLAYWIAFFGLMWMGFFIYLFLLGLGLELYNLSIALLTKTFRINPLPKIKGKYFSFFVLSLALPLSFYSYIETLSLKVERIVLYTDKLANGVEKLKILHISDLHLGPLMGLDKINLIHQVYTEERPDLIVATGDLVDGNVKNKIYLAKALQEINPPFGKYAVLGNHEYYRGVKEATHFLKEASFNLLMGEAVYVKELNLTIVGIEDDTCAYFKACIGPLSDKKLLEKADKNSFVLYLKHKPILEKEAFNSFDLMLSGHTHGGLYYPLGKILLSFLYIGDRGFIRIENSYVYISKGVGTGGPPMRFLSPPDVAIIELLPK